jgi:23S rRNA (uracil1939-C5)-methyltransferase
LVDAYSGRGELAETVALDGVAVVAIEADAAATARARERLAAVTATHGMVARVVTALVEDALADALPADLIVLNPPRRGVDVRVTALLADAADRGVRGIVYVSCDPATLARDLARLPRWRIASVRCFDMFPQTAHVETVCVLVPEES